MKRIPHSVLSLWLAVGGCLFLVAPSQAFLGTDKFEAEVATEAAVVKYMQEAERGGYETVDTATLKQWLDEDKAMLIVDTMPFEASYKESHIPGAVSFLFPIPEMTEWDVKETSGTQEDFETLLGPDKTRTIVIYCGFVKCTRSHNGAMWAKKLGYENVYRHPGGIFAWKGADYETESGE